jgi:hypothetical protein
VHASGQQIYRQIQRAHRHVSSPAVTSPPRFGGLVWGSQDPLPCGEVLHKDQYELRPQRLGQACAGNRCRPCWARALRLWPASGVKPGMGSTAAKVNPTAAPSRRHWRWRAVGRPGERHPPDLSGVASEGVQATACAGIPHPRRLVDARGPVSRQKRCGRSTRFSSVSCKRVQQRRSSARGKTSSVPAGHPGSSPPLPGPST